MILEVQDITFAYPKSPPILKSINLQLRKGEITVITGNTGSGKSTLAKCLAGFIPNTIPGEFSGKILLENEDTADLSLAEMSRRIALVQQDTDGQICTLTTVDEVAFGPENFQISPAEIEKIVDSSLEQLECSHLKDRTTTQLSGGERQRIVIASILACQPEYLILDEPTSSLDLSGVSALRESLVKLKESGFSILVFEHRLHNVVSIANQVLHLQNGSLSIYEEPKTIRYESESNIPQPSDSEILTASNISYSYDRVPAVRNVDLRIHRGEVIGLMGDNGSGKSTLLALLGGLLVFDDAKIYLNSIEMTELSPKEITSRIAVVFQNPTHQIFERTVWNEQLLACRVLDLDETAFVSTSNTLLEQVQLTEMKDRNPFSLSHGQKRRLNVTSTVAHSPILYLFDEPFIGQDEEGCRIIAEILLERARTDGACIVATHDSNFVRNYCNRLLFMENGAILYDGYPSLVLERLRDSGRIEYIDGGTTS